MAARPPLPPSPLARKQQLRQALAVALEQRDAAALQQLSCQWVHRQGVASLESLQRELASDDDLLWWGQVLRAAEPESPAVPSAASVVQLVPIAQPVVARPAPAPRHPALVSLRSWLADADGLEESPRAA